MVFAVKEPGHFEGNIKMTTFEFSRKSAFTVLTLIWQIEP